MARRRKNLFSSGSGRGRRDYRNASIGPDMGGYDAKGNTRRARSVKKGRHVIPASRDTQRERGTWQAYRPGEIGYVRPKTTSAETAVDHSRRRQRGERLLRPRRTLSARTILLAVLAVAAVIAFAAGVASCVFNGSVNNRMTLRDDALSEVLVVPTEADAAYYLLLAGNSHVSTFPDTREDVQETGDPDVLFLVRVDAAAPAATVISIPANLTCTLSDGTEGFISHEYSIGGYAGLVELVAEFAGVDISHFAIADADGFVQLVDALGGISMDVSEEVDDPEAGSIYIAAGDQTLDGAQALVLARAKNYSGGYETRAQNQMEELVALVAKASSGEGLGAQQSTLDAIAGTFQTDLAADGVSGLLASYAQMDAEDVYLARVPGYSQDAGGTLQFTVSSSAWASMMEKVGAGGDPNEKSEAVLSVKPADYTVTVLNGAGIDGVAGDAAEALQSAGYQVKDTGNTDQFAYNETLVVYKEEKNAAAAQAVADALGVGRAVEAGIYYDFDTDLEVVIGQDWKPAS